MPAGQKHVLLSIHVGMCVCVCVGVCFILALPFED